MFSSQQYAEKYLKAYFEYKEIEFKRTHDLDELIMLATEVDEAFYEIIELGERLTDYAVDIRYPFIIEEPSIEEAKSSIEIAIIIKNFILTRLPRFS